MDARFYQSEEIDIQRLANDLENMYRMQGYEVQQVGNKDQMMVQLKKGSDLVALIGMQTALSVIIQRTSGGTITMIGQQKWLDKAAVGAVGVILPVLWPLMITAGAGAIKQASLGNQVLNAADGLIRQQIPGVRMGPVPVHLAPQIQQQWAPPPQQYVPAAPVYTPSTPAYVPPAPVNVPATQSAPAPAPAKLRCPTCNTPYEEGDTFCSGCGRSLAPQKTLCPNCKTEIKPGVAFCPKCGTSVFQTLSGSQAAIPPAAPAAPNPTIPAYTPPPAPKPKPVTPPPAPYVPPVPQEPPVIPKPSVTMIPGTAKPAAPQPTPKQPPVPVYKPPTPPAAPPIQPTQPATPVYTPPVQQPTLQTNVSPDAPTLQQPRQPIKAKPTSQPAAATNVLWGKLIFSNGKEVQLISEQILVGRVDHDVEGISPEVDLSDIPGADTTSRIHATIEHVGSSYMLTDLNSTNSTRINGKRLEPDKAMPINDGDTLHFGKVTCTFKKA